MRHLTAAAGRLVDRIKINRVERVERQGRAFWLKRRRAVSAVVIPAANRFFHAAANPVRILERTAEWHDWEVECVRLLHDSEVSTWIDGSAVAVEELPGQTLSHHLDHGTITRAMFRAAAKELRRAHELPCTYFPEGWSHGDPHTGNFLFDEAAGRARLIDFEVRHLLGLSATQRHTDDLLVFLQDTLGRLSSDTWLALAEAFVEAYDRPDITSQLVERLVAPRGIARLWWAVRTTYLAPTEIAGRLHALRQRLA